MQPTVRAVIFDYGGVIRREDIAEFDAFGIQRGLPPGAFWAAFHDIPEYVISRTGRLDSAGYRAAVVRALAEHVGSSAAEGALSEWERLQAAVPAIEPEMRELLQRLRGRVRLGLLSNIGAGGLDRLRAAGVAALFDDVICSADVGLAKPDPAVFRLAAERLQVTVQECLFIDDMPHFVAAAREVGMCAHQYHASRCDALWQLLVELKALRPGEITPAR